LVFKTLSYSLQNSLAVTKKKLSGDYCPGGDKDWLEMHLESFIAKQQEAEIGPA